MLSQTLNHEDCDLLGYPLVTEMYLVNDLVELNLLVNGLEFRHSRSSSGVRSESIGLPNRTILVTIKYYDYDSRL